MPVVSAIIVRTYGGLGNQMFQYAAGRGIATRLGATLLVDTSYFETTEKRLFQLDRLQAPLRIVTSEERNKVLLPYLFYF
jgi:hypothetical protein